MKIIETTIIIPCIRATVKYSWSRLRRLSMMEWMLLSAFADEKTGKSRIMVCNAFEEVYGLRNAGKILSPLIQYLEFAGAVTIYHGTTLSYSELKLCHIIITERGRRFLEKEIIREASVENDSFVGIYDPVEDKFIPIENMESASPNVDYSNDQDYQTLWNQMKDAVGATLGQMTEGKKELLEYSMSDECMSAMKKKIEYCRNDDGSLSLLTKVRNQKLYEYIIDAISPN